MVFCFLLLFALGFFLFSFFVYFMRESKSFYAKKSVLMSSNTEPRSYPFLGSLISFYKNQYRLLDWYTELLSESPCQTIVVSRLGARRAVVTANPANVEHMLKTNFNNFPKGKPFTEILGDLLGCGIFNVDGELWSTQRKLASHEFNTKSLREFVVKSLHEEVENRLLPLLEEAMLTEKVIDFQDVLRRFAFDTVSKVSFGQDPCCLDLSRPVPPLVKAFDSASEISAMRGMAPVFLVWKMKRAFNIGSEKKLKQAVQFVHGCVLEIIRNKKRALEVETSAETEDLLSRLLSAGHDEEVKMMVKEVKSMVGNDEKRLDFQVLKEMNCVKACLCESMRLYPPVAWDSKHAVNDDVLPDGTFVGKGDRVTYFPYGMGRMEELWGKDRLEFKPDRWFEEPGAEHGLLKAVSAFNFRVFQAGPRVCLGKEMAFIQMKYVVASILRRFEIRVVCQEEPVLVPLLTAHMAGGLKVVVRRRELK
ncbi:hypothetical protein ES319_D03G135500v1 [Gossypium barbadense]|uniref:Cytochrome P450 n=2 Tax=Gossypium TaxID=3633 RepID=A0A5J5S3X6_GOSBA|nr:hypothetical protein ES319_D03G135500v1 [Gossypium barbadense]TYG76825.1 hypothetical protein ES288_D03G145900v1 [Gossypium darwinii]